MIKAVFFDIDGTLGSFKTHRIPDSTKQALNRMREMCIRDRSRFPCTAS